MNAPTSKRDHELALRQKKCWYCGAEPGDRCRDDDDEPMPYAHVTRGRSLEQLAGPAKRRAPADPHLTVAETVTRHKLRSAKNSLVAWRTRAEKLTAQLEAARLEVAELRKRLREERAQRADTEREALRLQRIITDLRRTLGEVAR